jgi:outer membrane protein OmpA-like peptidoglycan-associated protein
MKKPNFYLYLLLILLFAAFVNQAFAQIAKPTEVARQKSDERANAKIDEGIDTGLNKIEEGIGSLFKKRKGTADAEDDAAFENEAEANVNEGAVEEQDVESPENPPTKSKQVVQTYSKFDFVPGEKIIFYDDFANDPVGDFPAKWNTNNSAEVVTLSQFPGKWMKLPAEGGNYFPELALKFPENVTIEFDFVTADETNFNLTYYSEEVFDVDAYGVPGEAGAELGIAVGNDYSFVNYTSNESMSGQEINTSSSKGLVEANEIAHVSIWVQKSRIRMYMNENKVFDIPKGIFPKYVYNRVRFETYNTDADVMISNVRIAVGAPDTRNQLITEGKFTTHGILFDVNSDKIKPESHGCIKEIADVLKENPAINVSIIGHTDSDGNDASNLDLSKRRAASVKNYLASQFAIEPGRMQTDGKGETQPVDNNNTPEGKANNRRVEFVKL